MYFFFLHRECVHWREYGSVLERVCVCFLGNRRNRNVAGHTTSRRHSNAYFKRLEKPIYRLLDYIVVRRGFVVEQVRTRFARDSKHLFSTFSNYQKTIENMWICPSNVSSFSLEWQGNFAETLQPQRYREMERKRKLFLPEHSSCFRWFMVHYGDNRDFSRHCKINVSPLVSNFASWPKGDQCQITCRGRWPCRQTMVMCLSSPLINWGNPINRARHTLCFPGRPSCHLNWMTCDLHTDLNVCVTGFVWCICICLQHWNNVECEETKETTHRKQYWSWLDFL